MIRIPPTHVLRLVFALLLLPSLAGCRLALWGSAVQESSPHVMASLSDRQYFWFLHRGKNAKDLTVWRVNPGQRAFEQYGAPRGDESSFRMWQVCDSWIWYLTNDGIWRIGRFPPDAGSVSKFEGKIINKKLIGRMNVMLVQNTRLIIGAEQGLYVFDRQTREMIKVGAQHPERIRETPFGIVVFSGNSVQLLDATPTDPSLADITVKGIDRWAEVPPHAYVTAQPERSAVVAFVDAKTMLRFDMRNTLKLGSLERIVEAADYHGYLCILTNESRLIVVDPETSESTEYCIYQVEGTPPQFEVQDGRLRCGSLVLEGHNEQLAVGVMRLYPGDVKALAPVPADAVLIDFNFGRKAPARRAAVPPPANEPELVEPEPAEPVEPGPLEPELIEPEPPAPEPAPPAPEPAPPAPEPAPEPDVAPEEPEPWFPIN